jgi:hypothetical protein
MCFKRLFTCHNQKVLQEYSTDYIKTKDKPTFDNIGNTTIIPTAVIQSY